MTDGDRLILRERSLAFWAPRAAALDTPFSLSVVATGSKSL